MDTWGCSLQHMGLQATKDSPLGMTLEPFKVGISMLAADLYRNERHAGLPIERRIASAAAALSSAALYCRSWAHWALGRPPHTH
eukprot:scaffold65577_cov66-Phaeocystis_antarctica.AAC.5